MVSKRLEKMLREWMKDEDKEIPEDQSIEDWLREYFISSPHFEKRLQEWVDKHRIHRSLSTKESKEGVNILDKNDKSVEDGE